jgi:UDPglucose--hexose-1-phosphate uridylyltransferase
VFEECSEQELEECARALREIIQRLNHALDNPPFNYFIHSLPTQDGAPDSYHWHIEILPQLFRAAGFELGSGSNINGVAPEAAPSYCATWCFKSSCGGTSLAWRCW